ncbi:MAG: hypothetical protein M0R37_14070 [Bacteroidales bacterium]|nr:hypothetical protein [Bacteroidales bacterium]
MATGKIIFATIGATVVGLAYALWGFTPGCTAAGAGIICALAGRWYGEVRENELATELGDAEDELDFADRVVDAPSGSLQEREAAEALRTVILARRALKGGLVPVGRRSAKGRHRQVVTA